jgi:hypothetical protein
VPAIDISPAGDAEALSAAQQAVEADGRALSPPDGSCLSLPSDPLPFLDAAAAEWRYVGRTGKVD